MPDASSTSATDALDGASVVYEDARVVATREAPNHYEVTVALPDGERAVHAVERVAVNGTTVDFDEGIWFVDATLDVGVPLGDPRETAWVWP